jgi:hypothetical protein
MSTQRHLTWETLCEMIARGQPFRLGIDGNPRLELMVEDGGRRLGLLIPYPVDAAVPVPEFENVDVGERLIDEAAWLYISTSSRRLFQEFHAFLTGVADSIQIERTAPLDAIRERQSYWKSLFARLQRLSPEEEIGIIGELWMLLKLITSQGTGALEAWTGPVAEPHDFRIGSTEYEVKTTRKSRRSHIVNGLAQLSASPGKRLVIVSLQIEPAGSADGFSLPGLVGQIEFLLKSDPTRGSRFSALLLDKFGYSAKDAQLYQSRFSFRSLPRVVPVDEACPHLVRSAIDSAVGFRQASRIVDVEYEIDLEGLGVEEGSSEYAKFIP